MCFNLTSRVNIKNILEYIIYYIIITTLSMIGKNLKMDISIKQFTLML